MVDALQTLLNYFQSERHKQTELRAEALNAINNALVETKRYAEFSKGGKGADRNKEFELAKLWHKASVAVMVVRAADPEFPKVLHEKALYWSDSEPWSAEKIEKNGIRLKAIHAQVQKLLSLG